MLSICTPVARSTESPTELTSSSPVTPCSGLNIATSLMPGALARISIVLRPSTSKPVWLVITPTARGEDGSEPRTSRKPSCSRTSIPFITIPLFGAGPCAAICGRQRPSPEAALFRYSGLRSGHKQDSNEGHEKKDSGTHAGIVIAIAPGGQRTIQLRFAKYFAAAMRDNGGGRLIGSELVPAKVATAMRKLSEAG